jgi:hypothetical protein
VCRRGRGVVAIRDYKGLRGALRSREGPREATVTHQGTPVFNGEHRKLMAPNFSKVSLSPALVHPLYALWVAIPRLAKHSARGLPTTG